MKKESVVKGLTGDSSSSERLLLDTVCLSGDTCNFMWDGLRLSSRAQPGSLTNAVGKISLIRDNSEFVTSLSYQCV
jgi:hypothetical protein